MNNKGMKFLAVLAVLAMAFAVFAVALDSETDDAGIAASADYKSPGAGSADTFSVDDTGNTIDASTNTKYVITGAGVTVTATAGADATPTIYILPSKDVMISAITASTWASFTLVTATADGDKALTAGKVSITFTAVSALTITTDSSNNVTLSGTTATISGATIGSGATVEISSGLAVTNADGSKILNYGTITNNGTLTNNGAIITTSDVTYTNGVTGIYVKSSLTKTYDGYANFVPDKLYFGTSSDLHSDDTAYKTDTWSSYNVGDSTFTLSGLNNGTDYTSFSVSLVPITIEKKDLTVTLTSDDKKTYDGTAFAYTVLSARVSGLENGDKVTTYGVLTTYDGFVGSFSHAASAASGKYTETTAFVIKDSTETNDLTDNYNVVYSGTLAIEKKALTVTIDIVNNNHTYNGITKTFAAVDANISGLENGDKVTNYGLFTTYNALAGQFIYSVSEGVSCFVKTNDIVIKDSTSTNVMTDNYDITYSGTYQILKKALTVTIDTVNNNHTYDGTSNTFVAVDANISGLENGDKMTNPGLFTTYSANAGSYVYNATSGEGKFVKTAGIAIKDSGETQDLTGCYDITYSGTYEIVKAPLAITAQDIVVTYGDAKPTLTTNGGVGWQNSETYASYSSTELAIAAFLETAYVTTSPAGTPVPITWVTGAVDDIEDILTNYDVTLNVGSITVNKKALTVAIDTTNNNHIYDGTTKTFAAVDANISGLVNSDKVTDYGVFTTFVKDVGTFEYNATSGAGKFVKTSDIVIKDSTETSDVTSNYDITYSGTYEIKKAALTITAVDKTVTYGDAKPTLTTDGGVGWQNGETYASYSSRTEAEVAAYLETAYVVTSPAGTPVAITWATGSEDVLEGWFGNYDITLAVGSITVNKAALTITVSGTATYGDANAVLVTDGGTGWKNSETYASYSSKTESDVAGELETAYTPTSAVATTPAVTWKATAEATIEGWFTNYDVTLTAGVVTISKAVLTVTPSNATITHGDATVPFDKTITGFKNGETAAVITGDVTYTVDDAAYVVSLAVGNHSIQAVVTALTADNYSFVAGPDATLNIQAKMTYELNGGAFDPVVTYQSVTKGEKAVQPAEAPKKAHDASYWYSFGGWYTTNECTVPFDFADVVINDDLSIYAYWVLTPYKEGGEEPVLPDKVDVTVATNPIFKITKTDDTDFAAADLVDRDPGIFQFKVVVLDGATYTLSAVYVNDKEVAPVAGVYTVPVYDNSDITAKFTRAGATVEVQEVADGVTQEATETGAGTTQVTVSLVTGNANESVLSKSIADTILAGAVAGTNVNVTSDSGMVTIDKRLFDNANIDSVTIVLNNGVANQAEIVIPRGAVTTDFYGLSFSAGYSDSIASAVILNGSYSSTSFDLDIENAAGDSKDFNPGFPVLVTMEVALPIDAYNVRFLCIDTGEYMAASYAGGYATAEVPHFSAWSVVYDSDIGSEPKYVPSEPPQPTPVVEPEQPAKPAVAASNDDTTLAVAAAAIAAAAVALVAFFIIRRS